MTDYAITFAPTFDRPPETMVGETVFDCEGSAIGWIVNATVGRSCASCPEMDDPDSYISHLQAALKWHDEHVPRPTNPRGTCVVLEGKKPPEEVLFIGPDGVTHYLPEGTGTCEVEYVNDLMGWHCKSCDTIWMGLRDQKPSYCMRCGGRIKEEAE